MSKRDPKRIQLRLHQVFLLLHRIIDSTIRSRTLELSRLGTLTGTRPTEISAFYF